jgi:hypothetical protein
MAEPHIETDRPAADSPQRREGGPHANFGDTAVERAAPRQRAITFSWFSRTGDDWSLALRALVLVRRWRRVLGRTVVRWRLALGALAVAPILLALVWPGQAEKPQSGEPRLAPLPPEPVSSTPSAPSAVEHEPELFDRIRDQRSVPFDQLRIDRGE